MKKLYKCYDPLIIEQPEQCIVLWANSEKKALSKCANIHKKLDIYSTPTRTVMKYFKLEEIFVPKECDMFVCYPKNFDRASEVVLISVPFSVRDIENYVMEQLVEIQCGKGYFRGYVIDKAVNCSLNELFYCDDKGWIFTDSLEVRDDIKKKAIIANVSVGRFMDEFWLHNVNQFFYDNQVYKSKFINYITSDKGADFDEGFFFYVCKKLMQMGEWVTYPDIRKVDLIAE
jgi:hypothetical protein